MENLILAHDFGTSGVKACIFDCYGNFLSEAYYTYETEYPQDGWAVHDPHKWLEAMQVATRTVIANVPVDPKQICAISFSSHGGALVPVDAKGEVLVDRVMVWNDSRCREEAKYIIETVGEREHYEKTGNSMDLSMSISSKLLWMRKHMPDVYKKTYKFLGAKEYVIYQMTGKMGFTDYSEQSSTGAYNLHTCDWDPQLVEVCQLDVDKMCEGIEPTTVVGSLTKQAAESMGLCPDTPVVLGSWDNYACATGGGIRTPGKMVLCMGTAGWFGINHNKPIMVPEYKTNVVHVGKDTFFTSIHTHSACAAYDWIHNQMCGYLNQEEAPFKRADEQARKVPAGADKLFFLPSMFTGNTFYSSNALCGTLVGLKMMQDNSHIIRAAMEGPAFDLMIGAEVLKKEGLMAKKCNLIGGGAKSNLWRQILADMFGVPMMRPKSPQHIGALGAALYAGVGTGLIRDFSIAAEIIKSDDFAMPNPQNTAIYKKLLPVYKRFYEQLMPIYEALQAVEL